MGRIACLDYGLARIGLAVSDERKIIASSIATIQAEKQAEKTADKILAQLSSYTLEAIIIGLPLHMNGKVGWLADEVRHFAALLEKKASCPIILWDERLSTLQAEKVLREANMSRKKRSKVVDGMAAVVLLQSYLDMLSMKVESIH